MFRSVKFAKPAIPGPRNATPDASNAAPAAPAASVAPAAAAASAAPAAGFPPQTTNSSALPSQTFGASRSGAQAAGASISESEVVLPNQPNVQFSVLHFPEPNSAAKQADFGKMRETAEVLIRREKPAGESKRASQLGAQPIGMQQGLNLPQAQEAAVRKVGRMRTAKQVDPNEQPWLLDVKVNAGAKRQQFRGTKQASITENSAYFLLLMGPPNESGRSVFLAHPISEWYTFLPVAQYDHLDEEEAESLFQKRNRIQNFFGIMATRRLERAREPDRDVREEEASGAQSSRDEYAFLLDDEDKKLPFGGARGGKRGAAAGRAGAAEPTRSDLMLLETADFSSSEDEDADADDIKEDVKDEKKPKLAGSSQKGESKSGAAAKKPLSSADAKNTKKKTAANASVGRWWKREVERRADKSTRRQERARSRKKRIGLADEEHGEMEEGAYDEALEYDEETSDLDYDDVDEESDVSDSAPHRPEVPSDDEAGARRKRNPEEADTEDLERVIEERGVQDDDAIRAMNESASEEGEEEGNEDAEKDENAAGPSRRRRRGESLSESSSESSSSDARADSSSSAPSDAELDDLDASNDYNGAAASSRKRRADNGDDQVIDLDEPVGNSKRGRFVDSESASASNGDDSGALFGGLTAALVASVIGPMPASNTSPTKQGKSNMDHKLEADIRRTLWGGRIALREFLKRIRAICRKMLLSDQQLAEKISSIMRRLQVRETREGDSVYVELPTNG